MKRNYGEILDKVREEIEEEFHDELIHYQDECIEALEVLKEDYWDNNEGDLTDLDKAIKKIPLEILAADVKTVRNFSFIFARLYTDIKNDLPHGLRIPSIKNFRNLDLKDILIVVNELAFFSKITGVLEKEMTGSRDFFFHDVPFELRKSWIFEKTIFKIMDRGLILKEDELYEEIGNCLDFLTYCSVMHGAPQNELARIEPLLKNLNIITSKNTEFKITQGDVKIDFECDEKLFFIIYFSAIFELTYKIRQNESYELMARLYALMFDPTDALVSSDDKEDLIKKRIKRSFGPGSMTKSSKVMKIKKLAKTRVRSLQLMP